MYNAESGLGQQESGIRLELLNNGIYLPS